MGRLVTQRRLSKSSSNACKHILKFGLGQGKFTGVQHDQPQNIPGLGSVIPAQGGTSMGEDEAQPSPCRNVSHRLWAHSHIPRFQAATENVTDLPHATSERQMPGQMSVRGQSVRSAVLRRICHGRNTHAGWGARHGRLQIGCFQGPTWVVVWFLNSARHKSIDQTDF